MTMDDESSIYVGGLPYSTTEETLRKVFDIYGSVVEVKIINDHQVRGKCYGFVTFTNPRSAQQAISDMDGQTMDGRAIRVNDVKTRGGRSNFGHQTSHRHTRRGLDSGKGTWERDSDYDYDRHKDGHMDRSQDRDHYREREYPRIHNRGRERDYNGDRDKAENYRRDMDYDKDHQSNNSDSFERIRDQRRKRQKNDDNHERRDRGLTSKLTNGLVYISLIEIIHPNQVKTTMTRSKNNWRFQIESLMNFNMRYLRLRKSCSRRQCLFQSYRKSFRS
ncbi:unnamed protein product [Cuscuta europaea]|uniref:RRM domain-containing protein n=1 Tax=Cuscuta europaea TaxID=41803 RepID=A0A9P0ZGZ6_CUSEU|nr:unnamed protein product [Cuscuta europaea]